MIIAYILSGIFIEVILYSLGNWLVITADNVLVAVLLNQIWLHSLFDH